MLSRFLSQFFTSIKSSDPILIFASHPVGYPSIKLLSSRYGNLTVVTHQTKSNDRVTNKVEIFCKQNNIPYYCPVQKEDTKQQKDQQWLQFTKKLPQVPRLGVVCSYGYMIPQNVLSIFQKGVILAHPSLIPKYRGGSPIFHAIANGEKQSGISYLQVSPSKFDQGNILYQIKHPLSETASYDEIEQQLSQLAASKLSYVIENLDELRPGLSQKDVDISSIPVHQLRSPIIKDKHLNVDRSAEAVYNWSRALITPRVKFNNQEIIVSFHKQTQEDEEGQYRAGQLILKGKKLYVKCSDKLLRLKGWQQIGKKALPIHTFINRYFDKETYQGEFYIE